MPEGSVVLSNGLPVLGARWQSFVAWWLSELREAIPSKWQNWIKEEALPVLLIRPERDFVACAVTSGAQSFERRFPLRLFNSAVLKDWLLESGFSRHELRVGLSVDASLFFLREFTLPEAALPALPKILDQEILRRTPFQPSDIWHAASRTDRDAPSSGVLAMQHCIVRKDLVLAALNDIGLQLDDLDFLASDGAPLIPFREMPRTDPPWALRAIKLLAAAGLAAALLGLVSFEWIQSSVANSLETSISDVRAGGQESNLGSGPDARLLAMKADVSIIELWEELSKVLPDHSFLTELRIIDGKVTISGFSSDAAGLVRLIDRSPLFMGAKLVAAITPDRKEQKDRFTVLFKVRSTAGLAVKRAMRPPTGDPAS
jgi:general secretion pathway protein L